MLRGSKMLDLLKFRMVIILGFIAFSVGALAATFFVA